MTDHPLLIIGVLALLALASAAVYLRTRLALRQVQRSVEKLARGELSASLPTTGPRPVAQLADTINRLTSQLDDRLSFLLNQRNELEAVLASMVEGVIAVDLEERIIKLNVTGARLLETDPERALGRSIQEVVRNSALQQFVADALSSRSPVQRDITLRVGLAAGKADEADRYLQAQGAALRDVTGQRLGALIVIHDVTRLRQLEGVRRDFVANVSHEIKTPVTAIKGFVETLLDGQAHDPDDARRFLEIIGRQADRLHQIVEDLLSLARIERDRENQKIALVPGRIAAAIAAAVESCSVLASSKRIGIDVSCPDNLLAPINAQLLEQAIVNLIDNALKYSPEGSAVRVTATPGDREVTIAVVDQGCGIEAEHLPRIFERFYRTDRARSRSVGGTGLGLAIVKHIAQAHRGHIDVQSTPGAGSTFRIVIPAR